MMGSPREDEQDLSNLGDAIAEEFDRMSEAAEAEESEEEITAEVEEDAEVEETAEAEEEAETEEEETEETAEEETVTDEEEIDVTAEEEEYNEAAPERWPDEIKEVYQSLPPAARRAMLEGVFKPMQRQYTQSTQEISQMRQTLEPMLQQMNQYQGDFQRMGVDPHDAFTRQMAWAAHIARVGPQQGIQDMSAAYGLDQQPAGQQEEEYLTPVERSLRQELDDLRGIVNQGQQLTEQQQYDQEQQAQQQYAQQVQGGLQTFINEQNDGSPAHPHVEKVAPAMAGLIRGGLINKADEYGQPVPIRDQVAQAYKMACDLDPSIRTAIPRKRQVARAKAARDVGVVTKIPAGSVDVEERSLSEEIENTYDMLNKRVG